VLFVVLEPPVPQNIGWFTDHLSEATFDMWSLRLLVGTPVQCSAVLRLLVGTFVAVFVAVCSRLTAV
jgi:hypothetical protein